MIPHLAMPRHLTVSEFQPDSIPACLAPAVALLKTLHDAFGPPFIQPIVNIIEVLIVTVQVSSSENR
jgi:hypothetical protein